MKAKAKKNDDRLEKEYIDNISENMTKEKMQEIMEMQELFNIVQEQLYSKYNYDWDNMTIEEKTPHRWFKAQYALAETFITGRWKYWLDVRCLAEADREKAKEYLINRDIPKIPFKSNPTARAMLDKCIDNPHLKSLYKSNVLSLFIDWLLYGFGDLSVPKLPSEITSKANEYWYREFKAQELIMHPDDYFGDMSVQLGLGKEHAYFPTPMHIVDVMTRMTMSKADKFSVVNDPCLGSGRMLLAASNYSLRLTGQDINPNIIKIAKINGYLYAPWIVELDDNTDSILSELEGEKKDGQV